MTERILVFLIEDNRLLRDGLAALLDAQPDLRVVGTAEGANVGLRHLQDTKPHVVLVDATLGNHDSRHVVESVKRAAPEAKVVVMDLLPAQQEIIEFIKAGANGFLVKDATAEDFVRTIRSVAEGVDVIPPALAGTLLTHIADQPILGNKPVPGTPALMEGVPMTGREREVIDLVTDGLSNKEIARRLDLATHTVKNYVRRILEKLALHSRLQLVAFAHRVGGPETDPGPPPPTSVPATVPRARGRRRRGAGRDRTDE